MNTKSIRSVALAVALLIGSSVALSAAELPKEDAAMAAKLVTAIVKSDYEAFLSDGEAPFKQFKKAQFEAVSAQLAPKLQVGHEISYLGELKQKGYRVTLWKLTFKDGSDDILATLSMKAGKVGGFFLR
jgi:hypothetical protein